MTDKNKLAREIALLAGQYDVSILYSFGSRAAQAAQMVEGVRAALDPGNSDLDLGYVARRVLGIDEKVRLASALEDLFLAHRVDLVDAAAAFPALAFAIVTGELLFAADPHEEAEFQLHAMRVLADLEPLGRERRELVLGG